MAPPILSFPIQASCFRALDSRVRAPGLSQKNKQDVPMGYSCPQWFLQCIVDKSAAWLHLSPLPTVLGSLQAPALSSVHQPHFASVYLSPGTTEGQEGQASVLRIHQSCLTLAKTVHLSPWLQKSGHSWGPGSLPTGEPWSISSTEPLTR